MMNYYTVGKWDLNKILNYASTRGTDERILDFNGIPCSVHGEPLENINGNYKGLFGTNNKSKVNEDVTTKIMYKINHPHNIKKQGYRGNRYIVAVMDKGGNLEPIVEVSNNGRCNLRCSQWARILNAKHIEDHYVLNPSLQEYNSLLEKLGERIII